MGKESDAGKTKTLRLIMLGDFFALLVVQWWEVFCLDQQIFHFKRFYIH